MLRICRTSSLWEWYLLPSRVVSTPVSRCLLPLYHEQQKAMRSFFFQSRRTSRLHIGVTSMDTPRERAAILRQRDASEHYIFRSLLRRPPPSADTCYFFISVQWRAFSPQSGNQRFVTLHYPLRSDARRRFHTLRAFFHGCVRTPQLRKGNEIVAARSIN